MPEFIVFTRLYNHYNKAFKQGSRWRVEFYMQGVKLHRLPHGKPRFIELNLLERLFENDVVTSV